jgi:hypothetical protein
MIRYKHLSVNPFFFLLNMVTFKKFFEPGITTQWIKLRVILYGGEAGGRRQEAGSRRREAGVGNRLLVIGIGHLSFDIFQLSFCLASLIPYMAYQT